jgi:serine/threonine-protein kinase
VAEAAPHIVGRYAIFDEIASGGMATVHIGRLVGPVGFSRTVAIKRLHPQFAKDPEFVSMFVDEARLAARIRHPNVVPTLDVVKTDAELFLVMDYVQGEALSRLMRYGRRRGIHLPARLVTPVMAGVLHGLHAAHTARGERGQPLHIVHRDVSPQNVLVGTDGVPRVFDFGIAKARGRLQTTREGQIKGKLAYMAPEQLRGVEVSPSADVYSASVVLWEALAGRRLFEADNEAALFGMVLEGANHPPSAFNPAIGADLDHIVMIGLAREPGDRFSSARAMASALERAIPCASATEIGEWVEEVATETLQRRSDRIAEIESQSEIKVLADYSSRPPLSSVSGAEHPLTTVEHLGLANVAGRTSRAHPAAGGRGGCGGRGWRSGPRVARKRSIGTDRAFRAECGRRPSCERGRARN